MPGNVHPAVNNAKLEVRPLVVRDGDTEEIAHLEAGDGHGSSRGEAGDDWEGDEVNEEAEMEEMTEEDEGPGEEGEEDGVLVTTLGVVPRHEGHDGGGADGDVLRYWKVRNEDKILFF